MPKSRQFVVTKAKGDFKLVERDVPEPKAGEVRIKVLACGVCHSDSVTKEGLFPGIVYPRAPGHEVAGVIETLGGGVQGWKVGQHVGVGWFGGSCGYCESCRRGDFLTCSIAPQIPGITYDGGYADHMIAPADALALTPSELSPVEIGPLMCAGVTTFNSLRHSGARPSDLVAILGIGGLGVQYAKKMGFNTVAIARGQDKAQLAKQLGADHYIDSSASDPSAELMKLGGAKVILATVTSGKAMSACIKGLGVDGKLVVLGAAGEPIEISALDLILMRRSIAGWPSGTSIDSEDTMNFSARTGVRSMNETYPLDKAPEAYERMMSGKARFRVVLTMGI
jgi:D-arabinose 1-dehydrogenase-like Zn-dependent alcohol dehydrogenase